MPEFTIKAEISYRAQVTYGAAFTSESNVFLKKLKKGETVRFSNDQSVSVKVRCDFLLKFFNKLEKKINGPKNIFQSVSNLSLEKVLSQINRAHFEDLPFSH